MKKNILLLIVGVTISLTCRAQTEADSLAVKETVKTYVNSFYLTKPEEGLKTAHPLMAKRTIQKFNDGSEYLKGMTYEEMANLAKVFNSKNNFGSDSKQVIKILDMMNQTASVKLEAQGWVDYIHLGKINGEWKIINILWQWDR